MKSISVAAILIAAILSQGCGVSQQMSKDCGGDLKMGCKQIFGDVDSDTEHEAAQDEAVSNLLSDVNAIKTRISTLIGLTDSLGKYDTSLRAAILVLQSQASNQGLQISSLEAMIANRESQISQLQAKSDDHSIEIGELQAQNATASIQIQQIQIINASQDTQIQNLQAQLTTLASQAATSQAEITLLQAQVAAIQTSESIVGYLDCGGDGPGFDEVVLRTTSGKLIAYFKDNGSREFLSVLTPGNYQTTDQSSCNFTVTADGSFCDSLGCR